MHQRVAFAEMVQHPDRISDRVDPVIGAVPYGESAFQARTDEFYLGFGRENGSRLARPGDCDGVVFDRAFPSHSGGDVFQRAGLFSFGPMDLPGDGFDAENIPAGASVQQTDYGMRSGTASGQHGRRQVGCQQNAAVFLRPVEAFCELGQICIIKFYRRSGELAQNLLVITGDSGPFQGSGEPADRIFTGILQPVQGFLQFRIDLRETFPDHFDPRFTAAEFGDLGRIERMVEHDRIGEFAVHEPGAAAESFP